LGEQWSDTQFLSSGTRILQRLAQLLNQPRHEPACATWYDPSGNDCASVDVFTIIKAAAATNNDFESIASPWR
jgi:hypothetical protein